MRTVELLLDPALDDTVRAVWQGLHAAGLPSLATHRHPTNRPHVTLVAAAALTPAVGDALSGLPLAATLEGTQFFPGKAGVLVWRVVPTPELRAVQEKVWHALDGIDRNPLHEPSVWTPHVSLALRTRPEHRDAARALLAGLSSAHGTFVGARSYDDSTRTVSDL